MKKMMALATTISLLVLSAPAHSALLLSPTRIQMTNLSSNAVVETPLAIAFLGRSFQDPTVLRASLYFNMGSGAFDNTVQGFNSEINLTNFANFTLSFNGQTATPNSAVYFKDTTNGLAVDLLFSYSAFTYCTGATPTLSLDSSTGAPQIPLTDNTNAAILSFSGLEMVATTLLAGTPACSQLPAPADSSQEPSAKYSGPEFSGLSAKGIMTGSSSRLEGKNLDEISSIEIGGKAATFKADGESALDLTLPSGLAPGLYDLVINSSAGKLTHINAIRVREPLKSFSITSRSTGKISEEQYQEHAIISSMQVPELTKARCVVNASSLAMAKAQAQRLCALVKAANPNIDTTIVEARSTVKDHSVFARVSYGWN